MRSGTVAIPCSVACSPSGASGLQTNAMAYPRFLSREASSSIRISSPPNPADAEVCQIVTGEGVALLSVDIWDAPLVKDQCEPVPVSCTIDILEGPPVWSVVLMDVEV